MWYYENLGPRDRRSAFEPGEFQFLAWPLAAGAMALAIVLTDVDGDALSDIVVGNDYDVPDNVFLRTPDRVRPHRAGADIDEAWGPLLQPGGAATPVGDGVQAAANVLQTRQEDGSYLDTAGRAGVAATGWSWSAQFGDLDNDGDLDLYIVNGMVGDPFRKLEDAELVEENQALRNLGGGRFVTAPEWRLGATESGRGMALGDLDRDGDLDIVVNNYRAPSLLFENRLCGGASVQVDLVWSGTANRFAIGASLRLDTDAGRYRRDVQATSGYLSSNPPRVHFGLPAGERPRRLTIRWPDGSEDVVGTAHGLAADTLLTVTR